MSVLDLTRWNRAGLSRFRYVDGNALTYYEELRQALRRQFGNKDWPPATPDKETQKQQQDRLVDQFHTERADWGVELARELARGTHVLTEYLDAYANEATLRTATQWDHVRRMVEMLDYHPAPPASAGATLVINAKGGRRGRLAKGFAVRHSPDDGGASVVFETLTDVDIDGGLNELRLTGHAVSTASLADSSTLHLEAVVDGIEIGDPILLERAEFSLVRLIAGIEQTSAGTVLTLNRPIGGNTGFTRGGTVVHLKPADKLTPLGPVQADTEALGDTLHLTDSPSALSMGDVVYITDGVSQHQYYQRVRAIEGRRLKLAQPIGQGLRFSLGYCSRARVVSAGNVDMDPYVFTVVGDLSVFGPGTVLADASLKHCTVQTAAYQADPSQEFFGYTTFTLKDSGPAADTSQPLYFPAMVREWEVDAYLHDSAGDVLPQTLETTLPTLASRGDFVVVVSGKQLAWGKLDSVALEPTTGRARLSVARKIDGANWHVRASGRFYLSRTSIYSHFTEQVRLQGGDENEQPINGSLLPLVAAERPDSLTVGRRLWIERRTAEGDLDGRIATVTGLSNDIVTIDRPLPAAFTVGNTVIRGNLVAACHGETQNEQTLGSGDGSKRNQFFVLEVMGVAFVADPTQPAGVRADIEVRVAGQRWRQVGTLDDSGPGDPHYVIRITEVGFVRIDFGDGVRGRRLPSGADNVIVRYRLGTGHDGNLPANSLEEPARASLLVDTVRQPLPATGGTDMESIDAIKRNGPASLLTLERAVSADDYGHLAAAHAAVGRARAFARPSTLRRARIEVVVVPAGGVELDDRLQATLEDFLEAHSLPGVAVMVSRFEPVRLHLHIRLRVVSAEYDPQLVRAEVVARLETAFALERREIGAPLYLSDVFAVVEALPGVRNSSVVISSDRDPNVTQLQRIDATLREVVFLDVGDKSALTVVTEEFEL